MSTNPYEPPQTSLEPEITPSESDPRIVRDGKELIVPVDATLPMRCVKCNRPAKDWIAPLVPVAAVPEQILLNILIPLSVLLIGSVADVRDAVPEPLEPFMFPMFLLSIVATVALTDAYYKHGRLRKHFAICSFHKTSRYFLYIIYACMMVSLFRELIAKRMEEPPWWLEWESPIPIIWFFIPVIFAASYLQVNLHLKRDGERYRVAGCGKAFLDSFPDEV